METPLEPAEIVLSNNYFEFGSKIVHQKLGTGFVTKFFLTYTSKFVINFERIFENWKIKSRGFGWSTLAICFSYG